MEAEASPTMLYKMLKDTLALANFVCLQCARQGTAPHGHRTGTARRCAAPLSWQSWGERVCVFSCDSMYVQTLVPYTFVMIPDTGWFKHRPPNSFRRQCPRRFWELDPEFLHMCLMCPCRARTHLHIYFFSPDIWGFVFFGNIWVLRDPTFSVKKNKKQKTQHVKGSAGTH